MKKIISFSLWGNNFRYLGGAIQNVQLAKIFYPDWICRFYIGSSTNFGFVDKLSKYDNVEIVEMPESGGWDCSTLWRFYPAAEEDVQFLISRDADSRLGKREKMAVDEWIKSNSDFHIMRDHPFHAVPICAGMWGAKGASIKDIKSMIEEFKKTKKDISNQIYTDQIFLAEVVYPAIKDKALVHDEFFENKNFPKSSGDRDERHFVGQAYDGDGSILDVQKYGKQYYQDFLYETEKIKL